jgi:ParB family chromosome partitioning protein
MGVRVTGVKPQLSPVSSRKDVGRRRLRNVGSIAIDRVIADPHQPRTQFSDEGLQRLASSIRAKGQLLPIHVRWSSDMDKWVIVSGERRWRAAQAAGLSTIDCYFAEDEIAPSDILEQQLVENLLREDLRPIEEARAFEMLMSLNNWNGNQVAKALHVPASKVSRALALLDLPEDVQEQVDAGVLPARSAYEVSKLPDDESRRSLAAKAANGGMTNRDMASAVRQQKGMRKAKRKPGGTKLDFWSENGWKITASSKSKGNYHELEEALSQALDEVRLRINNNVLIY